MNQYKENINSFKSIVKEDIDMTKEENIKKFHAALESIEINTNAFFEADRADKLNDSELNGFKEYTDQLYKASEQIFKKYVNDKFFRVDKPFGGIYNDLFQEKYVEVRNKTRNVMKKKDIC